MNLQFNTNDTKEEYAELQVDSQTYFLMEKHFCKDSHVWSSVLILLSFLKHQMFDNMALYHREKTACAITW
jgi:hypothetical protein